MTHTLRLETITLGDELLLGIRENSHLTYLGDLLARHGMAMRRNSVIRDESADIKRIFIDAWNHADIVITTGGLGPTTDDITRETIAQALGLSLVHDAAVEEAIRDRFAQFERPMTENNLRQAKVLEGADVIPNSFGTAPGLWLEKDGKRLIMLPGPPMELYPMFENQVLPRMQEEGLIEEKQSYLQLRTCGAGESSLETKLRPLFDPIGKRLSVGYCAHEGLVDVRLGGGPENPLEWAEIEALGEECKEVIGDDFVSFGHESIALLILSHLRSLGKHLAVAESCTGGMLSSAFVKIPGASKVFMGGATCYTNEAKVQILDVPDVIIQQHGAVSAECVAAMATGAAEKFSADYALSVTGIAGPGGGTCQKPVGTVYLGYHSPIGVWSQRIVYPGNRQAIQERAVYAALDWMRRKLKKYEVEDILEGMAS